MTEENDDTPALPNWWRRRNETGLRPNSWEEDNIIPSVPTWSAGATNSFFVYQNQGDTNEMEKRTSVKSEVETVKTVKPVFKKPRRIALVTRHFSGSFKRFYPDAAVLSSPEDAIKYDLLIFTGGEDVNPEMYGERNSMSYSVNSARDEFEIETFRNIMEKNRIKILGVCRGHQLIHVAGGGHLYQDFASFSDERGKTFRHHGNPHPLEFLYSGESIISKFFQDHRVCSLHHQAVRNLWHGLMPICVHKDILEGSENNHIITVQFHPEFDWQPGNNCDEFFKFIATEW